MKKLILNVCCLTSILFAQSSSGLMDFDVELNNANHLNKHNDALGLNVGFKVGTQGFGLDVAIPLGSSTGLRFSYNGGATFEYSFTDSNVLWEGDFELKNYGLLVDFYPFENIALRGTLGAYVNKNKIVMTPKPAGGNVYLGGVSYSTSEIDLQANVDFPNIAPYIGVGYGNDARKSGWGLIVDVGVMVGNPTLSMSAVRGDISDTRWEQLQPALATESEKLQKSIGDKITIIPVVMIGVNYTF